MLQVAWSLQNARLVEKLRCGRRAQVLPVLQHPHQFFVRRNFYKLNDVGPVFLLATASRAEDDGIAVGQAVGGLEIMEDNSHTVSPLGLTSRTSLSCSSVMRVLPLCRRIAAHGVGMS